MTEHHRLRFWPLPAALAAKVRRKFGSNILALLPSSSWGLIKSAKAIVDTSWCPLQGRADTPDLSSPSDIPASSPVPVSCTPKLMDLSGMTTTCTGARGFSASWAGEYRPRAVMATALVRRRRISDTSAAEKAK